ncbi:heavy metal-binding protein HIP-like [Mytilus californianus]|uniref:heavy metal-binding protein HIP-like n=1 Tax=Mytilus californianus TaxID=6549 RepID=UPI002245B4EF|nr:heavy metal-binding protein HIP-like [Mytilus californianus]
MLTLVFMSLKVIGIHGINSKDRRLLMNDPDVIHQLELKIQNLQNIVSQIQQNEHNKSYIGFHAELSNGLQNLPHDTVIVFDKIVTNDGGAYDSISSDFTAPDDGLYSFAWTTLTNPGHIFHTQLTVDGRVISRSHNNAESTTDGKTATKNVVVHLKKGNRVRIQTYQSYGHILHADWSSFCGFKV